jgi:hypothetical protein
MGRSFLMLRMGVQGWARGPFRRGGVVVGEACGVSWMRMAWDGLSGGGGRGGVVLVLDTSLSIACVVLASCIPLLHTL